MAQTFCGILLVTRRSTDFISRFSMHSSSKKLFTGDISSLAQTFRCQYWMKAGTRPVDDITIMRFLLLSPWRGDGANDSARQLVAATKIARTVLAGRLVLVPIDSTNYSQTQRYRGPFSQTLFSRSIDRPTFFTSVDIWFGAFGAEVKFYDSPINNTPAS